jgi:hypothetical protein
MMSTILSFRFCRVVSSVLIASNLGMSFWDDDALDISLRDGDTPESISLRVNEIFANRR